MIQAVTSIGTLSVNGKEYWHVREYKHYTKEGGGKMFDIIDVTFHHFYDALTKINPGSTLKYVGRIYESKLWDFHEAYFVGETLEEYKIDYAQFFVNRANVHQTGEVTYRFYVSKIDHSGYERRPIVDNNKAEPCFNIQQL